MAASIFLVLLQGMRRWPPLFLAEQAERNQKGEEDRERAGRLHSNCYSWPHLFLKGCGDDHLHSY